MADQVKISNLIYFLGARAEEIFATFALTEEQYWTYKEVKAAFNDYFMSKTNIMFERAVFNSRCQLPTETVNHFITDLFSLVQTLKFGAMEDQLIRDIIYVGICDTALSRKLQLSTELTFKKAIQMTKQLQ